MNFALYFLILFWTIPFCLCRWQTGFIILMLYPTLRLNSQRWEAVFAVYFIAY